jgi:hypothetical protein
MRWRRRYAPRADTGVIYNPGFLDPGSVNWNSD